ncbi:hypothetical protein ASD04_06890 [Devosia sp. Root436]|uniref:hypothetical protein n=1 Tax=Devosia sp. Root436 TaxID=1736537 RepID=UPI0006FB1219|nr:hypothetical protein [Devosia sp. Root436]KQX40349.1 hypothetical protein ASD04_06890 [Devosia sp. Root436]
MTGGFYYLECAMRAAVQVEFQRAGLGPARSPAKLAWYYRPAEVFQRPVIDARSQRGLWHS